MLVSINLHNDSRVSALEVDDIRCERLAAKVMPMARNSRSRCHSFTSCRVMDLRKSRAFEFANSYSPPGSLRSPPSPRGEGWHHPRR
jgi:hypothetical protein